MPIINNSGGPNVDNSGSTSRFKQVQEACMGCVKRLFNSLIAQCNVFKKIIHLFLRIIYSDDWSLSKLTMVFYKKRLEILNKKKICLEEILKNRSSSELLLKNFDIFVKAQDEKGHEIITTFSLVIEDCKTILNKKLMFLEDSLITCKDKEDIEQKKKFSEKIVPMFKQLTEKVDAISDQKYELVKSAISERVEKDFEKKWKSLNKELIEAKTKAEDYYNKNLRDMIQQFKHWSRIVNGERIWYDIFNKETEFQEAIMLLLNIEAKNIKKIENGKSSSLDLMASALELNADRDIDLFALCTNELSDELLKLKIKDIAKDIEDSIKNMNAFERKAKKQFKVDAIE